MSPALLILMALLLLTGCSTLSPGQRVALYCNPLAHAVDLAMVGGVFAAGIVTHEPGVVAVGGGVLMLSPGPLPGVQCYRAIADAANG